MGEILKKSNFRNILLIKEMDSLNWKNFALTVSTDKLSQTFKILTKLSKPSQRMEESLGRQQII